jgi:hypothetical protein
MRLIYVPVFFLITLELLAEFEVSRNDHIILSAPYF